MQLSTDFLWGGATADFQCEGGFGEGGRGVTTHDYETDGNQENPRAITYRMPDGTIGRARSSFFFADPLPEGAVPCFLDDEYYPSHKAIDHYHHWREDLELLAGMGMNVYRFSICWSRIYPTGMEEEPNEEGLRFYEQIIDTCLELGMQPLVTIHHDELPAVLAEELDGWSSRKTIDYYTNYRQFRDALRGTRIGRLYDLLNGSLEPRAALELHAVASCAKRPWLEYLAKSGQRPLAAQLMRMNSIPRDVIANQRAKKPRELLGLTEGQWFEARRDGVQLTTEALECLNKLRKLGLEGVKISEVAEMVQKGHGMAAYRLGLIAPGTRDYSETVSDLLKAAGTPEKLRRKVYRRIVLRELEHATEWRDYIRQLRRLGEDLTDPQLILPRDVRQMHQRMIARENALKDAETLRKIEAQAKDFDKRLEKLRKDYTFEAAGLVLRPYDSAAEVIAEGRALAICIGSYAESYVKGSTIICCLRRAEEPDEPWRAVEFSTRGRLVQDRGYRNDFAYTSSDGPVMEPGTKKQLRNFWAAWNRAHGRDEKGRKTA